MEEFHMHKIIKNKILFIAHKISNISHIFPKVDDTYFHIWKHILTILIKDLKYGKSLKVWNLN